MIEVKGITKFYGQLKALDNVSFHVDRGEVLGFLGPNGAGKSTAMKILTTYLSATEGTASVGGFDVHVYPQEVRRRIGYLPETPPLYGEMTIEDYLLFAGRSRGLSGRELRRRLDAVVSDCGLKPKFKSRIVELSKGFKQRTGLAQALIHNPDVLILDEPTSGLDPRQIIEIRHLIDRLREGRCIIFSTHILQEATAVASRLVIINGGRKIADGTVDQLSAQSADTQSVRLLVRGGDGLEPELATIENVKRIDKQQGPSGYARFQLSVGGGASGGRKACEDIAALVHARGLALAELAPEKRTLEQIFLNLLQSKTEPETPDEAGKARGEAHEPAAQGKVMNNEPELAQEAPTARTEPAAETRTEAEGAR
jgi:ABC-2 type transport system ATP-binding protein